MIDISIVSPCPEQTTQEQPNVLENTRSLTDRQATDATNVETRLSFARSRREYDVTERTNLRTIAHIRQLIALECTRREGPCEDCPGRSHPLCCWNWDDRFPSGGVA
jgi:hypothetical protein